MKIVIGFNNDSRYIASIVATGVLNAGESFELKSLDENISGDVIFVCVSQKIRFKQEFKIKGKTALVCIGSKKFCQKLEEKLKPYKSVRQPQKLIQKIGIKKPSIEELFRFEAFAEQVVNNLTGKEAPRNREKERISNYKKQQ
jgi:hypothetical protein